MGKGMGMGKDGDGMEMRWEGPDPVVRMPRIISTLLTDGP